MTASMMPSATAQRPLEWLEFTALLASAASQVEETLRPGDPVVRQEVVKLLAGALAQGYYMVCHQDPDHPDFTNFIGPAVPMAAPNCDYMYHIARIDGAGVYRLWGRRGTNLFAHIGVSGAMLGTVEEAGPSLGHFDLDDMAINEDGTFEILLSAERPDAYTGNWFQLPPGTGSLSIRNASYDWTNEIDATYSIERLDAPVGRKPWTLEQNRAALEQLAEYPRRLVKMWLSFVQELKRDGIVNSLRMNRWAGIGGMAGQYYYEGLYDIAEDEALIMETDIPETAPYWSTLLTDELFNSLDWVNTQSSLNGHQAVLDADGRFRAVIAHADPGVPNWLDTSGRRLGCVQGRWKDCSSNPVPVLTKVKLADIRKHLPETTPHVSASERDAALRLRRRGAQLRRKW